MREIGIYDLYIPLSTLIKKDETKKILIMIYGGAWVMGSKDTFSDFGQSFSDFGYITDTIGYTLLSQPNLDSNIFRII